MSLVSGPQYPGVSVRELLADAIRDAGLTRRALGYELQRRHPRTGGLEKGAESWRGTLKRYLTSNEERRQQPDEETARLLAELLGKPADYFVTPPRGAVALREQNARLRAENEDLRRRLADVESGRGRS